MDKIWPEYSSQLYSDLYRTYHPSTYVEGRTNTKGNFELALDTIGEAIESTNNTVRVRLSENVYDSKTNPSGWCEHAGMNEYKYREKDW